MWCQNLNFGDLHGCLVGKYQPFSKISFLALKKSLNPSVQDLTIQWQIPFFDFFLNIDQNIPKKFRTVIIHYFTRKMLSESILDLGKCPNQKMHESESACFPVEALCKAQNCIWKQFSHKVLFNYYSKFYLERFSLYLTKSKNGFPIVFSNFQILHGRARGFLSS